MNENELTPEDLRRALAEDVLSQIGVTVITVDLDNLDKTAQQLIDLLNGDQIYELLELLSKCLTGVTIKEVP